MALSGLVGCLYGEGTTLALFGLPLEETGIGRTYEFLFSPFFYVTKCALY